MTANQVWKLIGERFYYQTNLQRKWGFVQRPLQRDFLSLQRAKMAIWPRTGSSKGFAGKNAV
jgi:hypothetical protein